MNLSKPEKDPESHCSCKAGKTERLSEMPLCKENEGYAGRVNHPAETESPHHSGNHQS
ncbi:MAG: hypothetical protein ACLVH0_04275 [Coprococcus eutactus]